ncbi:YbaB/EbfC family nucleoid-associated protein [Nonomuraea sp. MCN248]|uniref:YbaB/EbfC family nucleoid-associated protein n=1 Tax=Nonomuraea corallina TaxID=2989783 RepID=A0ABT4S832_9ACTN|nr:YbaB/EbfC family nucleoid-associated protein [Nonomuraea corallina]MDA0633373.1 YbaB/EbfC family nucleoid-associated protein [Nonomuraea corallina]
MAEREFHTGDPELDRIMAEFKANSRQFSDVMGEVDGVAGRAATPDDKIKVRVSASGQLTALHIDPRAMRMSSQELAQTIIDLSHRAAEDAARHLMRVTRPYLEEGRGR